MPSTKLVLFLALTASAVLAAPVLTESAPPVAGSEVALNAGAGAPAMKEAAPMGGVSSGLDTPPATPNPGMTTPETPHAHKKTHKKGSKHGHKKGLKKHPKHGHKKGGKKGGKKGSKKVHKHKHAGSKAVKPASANVEKPESALAAPPAAQEPLTPMSAAPLSSPPLSARSFDLSERDFEYDSEFAARNLEDFLYSRDLDSMTAFQERDFDDYGMYARGVDGMGAGTAFEARDFEDFDAFDFASRDLESLNELD